jgi:sugar lactone lactonase YvrE
MIALFAAALALAQEPITTQLSTEPGLTVWVWDVDGRIDRHPKVAEGQVPNAYTILPILDVKDGFESQEGMLKDSFIGRAFGWIEVPKAGRYRFRLTCDDGAQLSLGGRLLLDTERGAGFTDETSVDLKAGVYPVEIPFYEDGGNFNLRLEWQRPGDTKFAVVPTEALKSEAGQTRVVAPGIKRWFYGADPRRPGDGRPLEGIHPSYRLETFRPPGFTPAVGGMTFLPDGRLAICTWDRVGAVHIISGLNGPAEGVKVEPFAEGLGEPLGIAVIDGDIWVTQKGEVTRLRDTDKDGKADRYDAMAGGWPASHNYHEFTFNLVPKGGKYYLSTSVPLRGGNTYYNPGSEQAYPIPSIPGSILQLDPRTGNWFVFASGLRTPNGMGVGVDGELFVCDNQGSWLPCSKLIHVKKGGFYGHQETPNGKQKVDPPALWLPHGEISNSPSEPVLVKEGPFKGQMFFGDVTYGGIQRTYLEKVDGVYQGAVFRFSQGLEAGVNRLAWGPDGKLYVGGIGSNGNWNHQNHRFGLQRLAPTKETAFEMLRVKAERDGFTIDFTEPADAKRLADLATYQLDSFRYEPSENYGGPKVDMERFAPLAATPSKDGKSVRLKLPPIAPGRVVHIRLDGLVSAKGKPMWTTETWYTLNRIPKARP